MAVRSHFTAIFYLSTFGIIVFGVMIWAGFFWRERLWTRSALLALLIMTLLVNPIVYFYGWPATPQWFFCVFVLFPLLFCFIAYRGRRFLAFDILKLLLAILIFFSIHIPVMHGDDYSVMWKIGPNTKWDSALSFLPIGIFTGSMVVNGMARLLYYGIVALSALILYAILCYFIAAMITALWKKWVRF